MTKILSFALKIKGGGREGGTCEVLRPCHPPSKKENLEHALTGYGSHLLGNGSHLLGYRLRIPHTLWRSQWIAGP